MADALAVHPAAIRVAALIGANLMWNYWNDPGRASPGNFSTGLSVH
jgi:hypothetical protein